MITTYMIVWVSFQSSEQGVILDSYEWCGYYIMRSLKCVYVELVVVFLHWKGVTISVFYNTIYKCFSYACLASLYRPKSASRRLGVNKPFLYLNNYQGLIPNSILEWCLTCGFLMLFLEVVINSTAIRTAHQSGCYLETIKETGG